MPRHNRFSGYLEERRPSGRTFMKVAIQASGEISPSKKNDARIAAERKITLRLCS